MQPRPREFDLDPTDTLADPLERPAVPTGHGPAPAADETFVGQIVEPVVGDRLGGNDAARAGLGEQPPRAAGLA